METLGTLRTLIVRHAMLGVNQTAVPGLRLMRANGPTMPAHNIAEPMFGLVAQGSKRTVLEGKTFAYGTGQYLTVSLDLPLCGSVLDATEQQPFLSMSLSLRPAAIAALLLEIATPERSLMLTPGLAVSDASPEIVDVAVRMVRLLERPEEICMLAPMLERELLWRLLMGPQGAMVRQIGLADSHLRHINRAIGRIRTHYAEILRVEDLAKLAAMSVPSFHRHFRAATAMSPIQFQKQIRMQEARTLLLTDNKDIASVAVSVGYDSHSQFSREYGRHFGLPPSQDAARLRGMTPPELLAV